MKTQLEKQDNAVEKMNTAPTVAPWMDIYESQDEIVMLADLPGVSRENLELKFENNELTIRGAQTPREKSYKPLFRETRPMRYERSFKLPSGLDITKIKADLSDGLLKVTLPKSEEEKPHTIPIGRKA